MKTILYIIIPLLFGLLSQPQKKEQNVTVILHLDEVLSQTEQMVYLFSFCSWISGSEKNIWDSIQTHKGQKVIRLHAYTPIDNQLSVMFSKEGPDELKIYALPNDTIEIDVSHTDVGRRAINKKARKGKAHNDWVESTKASQDYWKKRRLLEVENNADSLAEWDHKIIDFYRKEINNTQYSFIASTNITILRSYLKNYLHEDTIQAIREQIAKKFPDNPRNQLDRGYNNTQTENSVHATQRIKEIEIAKANYKRSKQHTRIGNTLNVNLCGMDGNKIALSELTDCQYIYVDVWASWCKPCRAQFPHIKKALNKYSQALKVYAISIDKNHKAWIEAIKKDSLLNFVHVIGTNTNWEILKEVSDLGVERIPRNFLLDSNHRIIAKDLHDNQLMEFLDSLSHK